MAGTKAGGAKAAATNKIRHGTDFYAKIGTRGGQNGTTGGFASDVIGDDGLTGRQRASVAGTKGGQNSKRKPTKRVEEVVVKTSDSFASRFLSRFK